MDIIAETNLNREILQELKGTSLRQSFARFRRRLDGVFLEVSNEELYSLKKFIFYRLIRPRLLDHQEKPWQELENAVVIQNAWAGIS
jgi:hypothetical protein